MSTLLPLSNRLFAQLLVLMFVLSLFHVKTATNPTKLKEFLTQERTEDTFNNYSAQNSAAADSTNSRAHNPSRSSQSEVPQDNGLAKGNALEESLQSAISGNFVALKNSASFLPVGVEVELVEGKFQLKFNGNSMNYDNMTNALSYIHEQFKPFRLGNISISNLPLSKVNGRIIHQIIGDHSDLDKFSLSNCFFNENEFFREFPILSLTELELSECDGIDEILKKTKDSLEVLQLKNNSISLNFGQLTELLSKFTNLKKLTLDSNGIDITGFEVFFDFIFNLEGLTELNLVNDGVVEPFLRFLSNSHVSSPLETLTLRELSGYSYYRNLDSLAKLKLKTLCLALDGNDTFYNNLSTYLSKQETLQRIIHQNSYRCCLIDFRVFELITERKIVFDSRTFNKYYFNELKNVQQLSSITNVRVTTKQDKSSFDSLLSSVHSLPNLLELNWENEEMDLSVLTNKTPNLESLTIEDESFQELLVEGFFTKEIMFPKLKKFGGLSPFCSSYLIEDYSEAGNFCEFLIDNPSIKIFETNHSFLMHYLSEVFKLNDQLCIKNIEEMLIGYDCNSNFDTILYCLQLFPNVKKLQVNCGYMNLKDYMHYDSLDQMRPTKIEELWIKNYFNDSTLNFITIENLFTQIPNVKILSFEKLPANVVNVITNSLKHFPQLIKLEIKCCEFFFEDDDDKVEEGDTLIYRFINELKSLKYLAQVRIELLQKEQFYREELDKVVLPFSKKKIAVGIKDIL